MKIFFQKRIDSILIWGHGMQYFNEILNDIRAHRDFKIVKIQKHKPKDMRSFVKKMYSHDYAPFWHLKSKTNYLLKTPQEVGFVFIENSNPIEDYLGESSFRHKESLTLKNFKEELRSKYNPREDGQQTHNHVLHATDSQEQTNQMLKYLGYIEGVRLFNNSDAVINMPNHIKGCSKLNFRMLKVDEIFCNIATGDSWDQFTLKMVEIQKSPQFIGISQDMSIYKDYIDRYLGGPLQNDYNLEKYSDMSMNFEYLSPPHEVSFVIVEKRKGKFVILDGLHRASCHIKQGHGEIKVCQVLR
jgi:hypothetical protein